MSYLLEFPRLFLLHCCLYLLVLAGHCFCTLDRIYHNAYLACNVTPTTLKLQWDGKRRLALGRLVDHHMVKQR
jgi:hypothetical protein